MGNASMLRKELGLLDVFCIAAGAMISSGLFVLPGLAFAIAGPAIILAYGLAGLLMIPTMLSQAELATAMPKSGGSYVFVERSLGPAFGTMAGLANWLSIMLKATFALIGIGALSTLLFPSFGEWGIRLTAISACVLFALVNVFSVKGTGRLQSTMVLGLLAILALFVFMGIRAVEGSRCLPFMPSGLRSVFAVAGMVFVSFGGLTKVVDVSEEVRNPQRNLPLGMFLAFATVNVFYVLVVFIVVGTVDAGRLAGSLVPLNLSTAATMGRVGDILIAIAALLAFATTANAGILSASRSPMAMSRDGLLPERLSRTNTRFGTPHVTIGISVAFIVLVIATLTVEVLVKTASTMMIVMFVMVNMSVVVMRSSGIQSYRPSFRAPLYPWLQIAAIVTYGFLILEMGVVPLLLTGVFALAGLGWYVSYVAPRIERESAIVYLVRNIVSSAIGRIGLEEELRRIGLERNGVELDRFDRLAQECTILDIHESIPAKELFQRVAEALAPRLNLPAEDLYELFLARERETSTVILPGLAIPHVVVEGKGLFDLLLVRCRKGAVFSELHPPVKTVFVLIGSTDERNYHLRALMTIAHIVQEPDFQARWCQARNVEQLRDVILLSSRKREKGK